jgi:hypothetical protein
MHHRKLWQLIASLGEEERVRFGRWLEAELGTRQQFVRRLAARLLEAQEAPASLQLWQHLYPGAPYDDGRMRKLFRDLTAHVEEFLAIETFRSDRAMRDAYLLAALNTRGIDEVFIRQYRHTQLQLRSKPLLREDDYWILLKLEEELYRFHVKHPGKRSTAASYFSPGFWSERFQEIHRYLDRFWISKHLRILVAVTFRMPGYAGSLTPMHEAGMELAQEQALEAGDLLIRIWNGCYRLQAEPSEARAEEVYRLAQAHEAHLSAPDLQAIHGVLFNDTIQRMTRTGEAGLAAKALELIDWGIRGGFLLFNGVLPATYYRNSIALSLRMHDYNRARQYLDTLTPMLDPDEQEEARDLGLAMLYYQEGSYAELFRLTASRRFRNVQYELNVRTLLLQAHYESGEADQAWLSDMVSSLIRYVRSRRNLAPAYQKAYLNRLRLLLRLIGADSLEDLRRLEESLARTRPVDNPDWLRQKIARKREQLAAGRTY